MVAVIKFLAVSLGVLFLALSSAYGFEGFDDGGGAGLPDCAACHADLANLGPDHGTHSDLANNDCNSCHGSGGRDDPPLDNCVRCHGRDADGSPSADFSAGIGRGLRQHHVTTGAAACGNCHQDSFNATVGSAPENVLPSFYPQALGGAGLDPCDGSEEAFPSRSVSLDNDGDGLTDAADSDCAPTTGDTDGDGIPDSTDPDDDNDGIGDALDTEPLVASNNCTTNNGINATLAGATISSQQVTCASKESVGVSGNTNVGIDGDLRLISENVSLIDTSVTENGQMEVINADPCPGCSVCGNGTVEAWEQCDDENTIDGDGCSSTCQTE